jgi:hypothetical protein
MTELWTSKTKQIYPLAMNSHSIKLPTAFMAALITGLVFCGCTNRDDKTVVKGKSGFYGVRFDSNKWNVVDLPPQNFSDTSSQELELNFAHIDGPIAFAIVDHRVEIPLEQLKNIIIERLKNRMGQWGPVSFTTDTTAINGKSVLYLEINYFRPGNLAIRYASYLYSGHSGSVQLTVDCPKFLWDENTSDIKNFLNGFEIYE